VIIVDADIIAVPDVYVNGCLDSPIFC
jgi:hypothetical protein